MRSSSLKKVGGHFLWKIHLLRSISRHLSSVTVPSVHEDHGNVMPTDQREEFESWGSRLRCSMASTMQGPSERQAIPAASQMLNSSASPDGYVLVQLIRDATAFCCGPGARQLHVYVLKRGFGSNVFVMSALISLYASVASLRDAHSVFDEIPGPNVVSWNTLISGYSRSGQFRKALDLFVQLNRSETRVDAFSFTMALASCARSSLLELGRSIHAKIVRVGLEGRVFVSNCLIDMYGKCGWAEDAIHLFLRMGKRDVISWNSVISASARNQRLDRALYFLRVMPNADTISYNEVINGISQFGKMEDALLLFSHMPNPNSSSWNSIITGYVNRNQAREALDFFTRMHSEGVEIDQFTFSSILSGAGALAALNWGATIHCCTIKCGLNFSVVVGSALVDMYSKCGCVQDAESIFEFLPEKNLITWNAMISGFAHNGYFAKVVLFFEQLLMRDLQPDEITFLNVLSACSHGGVPLNLAIKYLEMMEVYGIHPGPEHCCSMIRLMGQRGEIWRAAMLVHKLGFGACALVWRALLGACGSCRDLTVGKVAAAKVIQLEGDGDYIYVVMSNLCAVHGKWSSVDAVRESMRSRGMRKGAGFSWIEVDNAVQTSAAA